MDEEEGIKQRSRQREHGAEMSLFIGGKTGRLRWRVVGFAGCDLVGVPL